MFPPPKNVQTLLATFEQLPKVERSMVQLVSVLLEPVHRTLVLQYTNSIGLKNSDGKPLTIKTISPIVDALGKQGILTIDPRYSHRFWCNEIIAWKVTQSAVEDGCFAVLAKTAQKFLPTISSYGSRNFRYDETIHYVRCLREIRIGVFGHDPEHLLTYLQLGRAQFPEQMAFSPPLLKLCATPFDATWFRALPLAIQALALEEIVPLFLENLEDLSTFLPVLQAYQHLNKEQQGDRFRNLLITVFIIQGKLKEAQEILDAGAEVSEHLALQGWLFFLRGQNEQAIQTYELALNVFRKATHKKNYFSHLSGLFFLLALLKSQDPVQYNRIDAFLLIVDKQKINVAAPAYACFEAFMLAQRNEVDRGLMQLEVGFTLVDVLSNKMDFSKFREKNARATRIGLLLKSVILFWIDAERAQIHKRGLKSLYSRAKKEGYRWVAMELAELLSRLEEHGDAYRTYAAEVQKQSGLQTILPIIAPQERWERALKALVLLTANKSGDKAEAKHRAANHRLVWFIQISNTTVSIIQPKEQSMASGGRWSKGRLVSLKRLFSEGMSLDFLTDQDRRIVRTITQDKALYGAMHYAFNWERAMLAMVGHPLVFWYDSPSVNVEVVQAEPELLVQKEKNQVNIKFSNAFHQQEVIASKESPTRCQLIEITEAHKAIASVLGEEGLQVPMKGKERVLEVMHTISPLVTIQSAIGGGLETIKTMPADSKPHVQLLPLGEGLKLKILVRPFSEDGPYFIPGKGGKTIIAEVSGERVQTHRHLKNERTHALALMSACPSLTSGDEIQEEWHFDEPEACLELLVELQTCADKIQLEWPDGEKFRVTHPVSIEQLKVRIQRDNDWFSLSGEVQLDESLILDMGELLDLAQKGSGRFIPLGEGQFIALTERFRKQLAEISAFSEESEDGRKFHPLAAPVFQEITDQAQSLKVDKSWKTHIQRLKNAQNLQVELPSTLQATLRDYQLAGFHWLARLAAWGVGACLADDMGLGKTLQALALILSRATEGPVLVIAPISVCFNWLKEILRFAPTLNGLFFTGAQRQQLLDELKPFDVLVCSYGLLQQEGEKLAAVSWNIIVLDEAQAIKNRGTKRSKAAMNLKGSFKMILTGTPIENHLGELWNLFQFINPGLLGQLEQFNERFAAPIERHNTREARKRLKKLMQPFILRRTKTQVLEELPARTEITLHVEMSKEELAFYETLRRRALEKIDSLQGPIEQNQLQIFAEIMRLRRACCNSRLIMPDSPIVSTKMELFWRVVKDLLDNRHKVLVFSQFVGHLTLIRERLDREKVHYQYLDGSTPAKSRQQRVDAFQAGEGDLFLISLRAGGMGINLTAADYVIHMDPWWNPAVEDQASDRAHRIGQKRPVTIYRLVTKNSIEEMMIDLHQHKRHLADGLLDGSDVSGKLTADALLNMIRGQKP